MTQFRSAMSPEEQRDFLTHTRLFLSKDLQRILWSKEVYVLKHQPTTRYLHVSSDELFVLGCFGRGSTVAELVPHLIMNRRCPPLRDLYELILQAREANILNEQRDEEFAPSYPPRWWPSIDREAVQAVWWLTFFAGAIAFFLWGKNYPYGGVTDALALPWWGYLLMWPALSLCASFGSLLASAYVHRIGGEIQRPVLLWKTLLPRISCDWSDCVMGGPEAAVTVAKLRIIPFLLLAIACAALPGLHAWSALAMLGLLWRVAPFAGGPAPQWMQARHREPLLSVSRSRFFYHAPRTIAGKLLGELRATEWTYALWQGAYAAVWGLLVLWQAATVYTGEWNSHVLQTSGKSAAKAVSMGPSDILEEMFSPDSIEILRLFGVGAGLLAATLVGVLLYGWISLKREESHFGESTAPTPDSKSGSVLDTFDDSLLFRELPVEIRGELATLARTVSVASGNNVVGLGERGEDLYVIQSGEFDLIARHPKGGEDVVARLRRGDTFGELSFFGTLFKAQNLRARGTGTLIALSAPELEQTLKRYLSLPSIEEIVQKRTFLRRIPLSAGWEPQSITRFAKCARFETMKDGQVIIGTGRENRFFYLVQEGALDIRQRGRRRGGVHGGEFFGEISLLLNNVATSDVVSIEDSRCLVLQKSDFLALMGQDIELALQMENIASRRLGRPIFPFQGSSIEAIAN